MGVIQPKRGVIHPSTASKLSWRLRDPDVRVAVAGENKDGIDGHRHGTPLEYTDNLSGVVVGRLVRPS